jgi:hypothetical protein
MKLWGRLPRGSIDILKRVIMQVFFGLGKLLFRGGS